MEHVIKDARAHEYPVLILERHLDTFGHVNHAVYLNLFEEARWDMVTRNGYGHDRTMETRLGPVILECKVKFRRELKLRERVTIVTRVTGWRHLVGTIHQEMVSPAGERCAVADFKFGVFDLDRRKLVPPSPEWWGALGVNGPPPSSR